jgi:hypothetical protein
VYALNNPVFFIDPDGMDEVASMDVESLETTPNDPPRPGQGTNSGCMETTNPDGSPSGVIVQFDLPELVITFPGPLDHITGDGINVYGPEINGTDSVAGSGIMENDRGSGAMDADLIGDVGMLYDVGQAIAELAMKTVAAMFSSVRQNTLPRTSSMSTTANETVTVQRQDYNTSDPSRNTSSVLLPTPPRDTVVKKGTERIVKRLNTQDSVKKVLEARNKTNRIEVNIITKK